MTDYESFVNYAFRIWENSLKATLPQTAYPNSKFCYIVYRVAYLIARLFLDF